MDAPIAVPRPFRSNGHDNASITRLASESDFFGIIDRRWMIAELVAAQPRDKIAVAGLFAKPLRDLAEKFVAGAMAERVVDHLEPIEINRVDGEAFAV